MGLNNCCFCIPLRAGVTAIAVCSSVLYIGILIWLLRERQVIYSLQDVSAALAVFWSLVAVVGLYSVSALFGVIGGITQNRSMINIFRFLYWTVVILLLLSSSAIWIFMLIKQNSIIDECQKYLNDSNSSSSPIMIPNQQQQGLIQEDCHTATKQILIAGGIVVFVGNFIQIYFASIINAYATRLGQHGSFQHHQLHNLDDFPETSIKTNLY
ncbi:hypothetical protein V8B55DRAFT_1500605 [Mucor lusitanicus]|uniref:Transmembrane protein n=2 Tax=Mucor circinelloides f. lusitanicus TaxID=29924 RepID=A0A168N177_MUCCL|nr:hypothetical protein FB192DRAFT_1357535 [Mucor lusitanicus]OAD05646.1 hypothetical protein MUCCIDRAFT_183868 [Mucor lusitanicus CBS 277.49]